MQESGEDAAGAIGVPNRRSGSEETTRRLLDAAAEEFLERGYEAARVSDIARRCGVTTGAVYARWRGKSEVLVAALDHVFHQILPEQRLKSLGEAGTRPGDMMTVLGTSLVASNDLRDVMVQVFGSARNNEAIRASLRRFLNEEADQLSSIIETGKDLDFRRGERVRNPLDEVRIHLQLLDDGRLGFDELVAHDLAETAVPAITDAIDLDRRQHRLNRWRVSAFGQEWLEAAGRDEGRHRQAREKSAA